METDALFVSYIPFFDYNGVHNLSQQEMLEMLEKYALAPISSTSNNEASVEAVAWFEESDAIGAVLSVRNAEALAAHMLSWAEGDTNRFHVQLGLMNDKKYYLAILPNIQLSFDRWYENRVRMGIDNKRYTGKAKALFVPILFESTTGRIPTLNTSKIIVRFLDYSIFNDANSITNENWLEYYAKSILIGELDLIRHDIS